MFDVTLHLELIQRLAWSVSARRFEDLVSVGVIAAYRANQTYDPNHGEFDKFVSTVVWREMIKFCNTDRVVRPPLVTSKSRKPFTRSAAAATKKISSLSTGAVIKEKKSEYDERESLIPAAIEALPEIDRKVIRLRYYHGMPFREIAKTVGRTVSHVMYAHGAALLMLRGIIDGR